MFAILFSPDFAGDLSLLAMCVLSRGRKQMELKVVNPPGQAVTTPEKQSKPDSKDQFLTSVPYFLPFLETFVGFKIDQPEPLGPKIDPLTTQTEWRGIVLGIL